MTDPMKIGERKAFEAWVTGQSWFKATIGLIRTHSGSDDYDDPCINNLWQGWQGRAHLSQPAQAVDVGAAAEDLYDWLISLMPNGDLLHPAVACDFAGAINFKKALAAKLRALSGEKAGRVDDGDVAHFVEEAAKIISGAPFPSGRSLFKARQIADLMLALPASPAPDKEGM